MLLNTFHAMFHLGLHNIAFCMAFFSIAPIVKLFFKRLVFLWHVILQKNRKKVEESLRFRDKMDMSRFAFCWSQYILKSTLQSIKFLYQLKLIELFVSWPHQNKQNQYLCR